MEIYSSLSSFENHFCTENKPKSFGIVIFGASGDLTRRKLIPSIYSLYEKNLLPKPFYILGIGRTVMDDDSFRESVKLHENIPFYDEHLIKEFLKDVFYLSGSYEHDGFYSEINDRLKSLEKQRNIDSSRIYYMATPPDVYCKILYYSSKNKLIEKDSSSEKLKTSRVIVEKPFGHDLDSAMKLDEMISNNLEESQIYRIDHYLGKETVQNILMFRFANSIFEPVWNRDYVESVWISADEMNGVGKRAGYFDKAGQLRDMFQNHMMQLLSLIAMEPPSSFNSELIRDEKVKLLKAIRSFKGDIANRIVRGRYLQNENLRGYLQEDGVDPESKAETFVAGKFYIDNLRWADVPFYLRSGKRMGKKETKIVIKFKPVPHSIFHFKDDTVMPGNVLVFNVQPEEGIELKFQAKHPGSKLCMSSINMDFNYKKIFGENPPEAYERLILDVMSGDQTLFIRHDDMKAAWNLFDPILKKWKEYGTENFYGYSAGTDGPEQVDVLLGIKEAGWNL